MQKIKLKIKIGTWCKIEGDIVYLAWQKCSGSFTKVLYQILRPWLFASSFASAVSRHELHKVAQQAQKHLREVTSRMERGESGIQSPCGFCMCNIRCAHSWGPARPDCGESVPNFTSGAGQMGWRGKFGNWDMRRNNWDRQVH